MSSFESPFQFSTEAESSHKIEQLEKLEAPAQELLEQLRENIEREEYDSLLGDDGGARLHTLLLSMALKEIYGEKKRLKTFFIKGGRYIREAKNEAATQAYIEQIREGLGKKTLVITEEIHTGRSVNALLEKLRKNGIGADVATFATTEDESFDQENRDSAGSRYFFGGAAFGVLSFNYDISGIEDDIGSGGHAVLTESGVSMPEARRLARERIQRMAHRIAEKYLAKERV